MRDDSPSQQYDTVVLDVDGTLVDTVYHHVVIWDEAFAAFDVHVPLWRIHRAIGMGGDRLVTEVAGDDVEQRHGDEIRSRHDQRFGEVLEQVNPLPGAAELIRELRRRGVKVVIASSGEAEQTGRLLDLVGAKDLAQDMATSADVEESKPAPDLVDAAVDRVHGGPAVVVGDAVWDIKAALGSAHYSVGLLSGGFGEAELLEAGADRVFASTEDLLAALDELPLRAGNDDSAPDSLE